jgi:lipoprotein-anchoring transpeptidase ErfK/SrfK
MSNFSCEPSFLLRGLSYMREICHRNVPNVPRSELATWMVAVFLVQRLDLTLDRRKRGQAFQPGNGMVNRLTTAQSTVAMRRWGPPAVVMLAAMAALSALTADAAARQARPAATVEATAPREAGEPIMAIVSIKGQKVTFYDADGWILRAPVSTGIKGRETPAGVFAVIEKDKDHHSTMYDDAWMPNMQRITWNGVALHGGPLPGYAASHGCVRMPYDFAEKLFDKTWIGMRVIISPNDVASVEFSHPALFVPNADALAAAPAKAEALAREAAEATKTADEAKKAAVTATRETASLPASLRKLQGLKTRADAELKFADKALAAAKTDQAKARAEELKQKAATKAADAATQLDTAKADAQPKLDAAAAAKDAAKAAATKKADTAKAATEAKLALEPVSVYISRATQKLYVRRNTHKPAPDGGGEVFDSSIEVPVTIRDPDKPIGTHVFTAVARTDTGLRWTAVTIDNGDDAKDALDRITVPQDVLDRIAPTAVPRSSIIVSDEPLSSETNYRTEFVAVLSNQPQGGFITRQPTPAVDDEVASGNVQDDGGGGGFFSLFQRNPDYQTGNMQRRGGQYYHPVQQGWSW